MAEWWGDVRGPDLERALLAIGERLAYPDPSEVATFVFRRLSEERPSLTSVPRGRARRAILRPVARPRTGYTWQRVVAVAAAVVVLAGGLIAFSPGARRAVADFLGLRGVRIKVQPSPLPSPGPLGQELQLGEPTPLAAAQTRVPFRVLVPTDPGIGVPQAYLGFAFPDGQVSLVYPVGPQLPLSSETGVGMLLTEFQAQVDRQYIEKFIQSDVSIEAVTVNGDPGFWISGGPHEIVYLAPNGAQIPDTLRLAGNVLLWQHGDVTLRIESALSKADALRIAESVR